MLDTPPLPIPNPQLAQQPVAVLLNHFTTALSSWLSESYGLVQTGIGSENKTRLPQLYRQDGTVHSIDLHPDDRTKALCFFERDGPSPIVWNSDLQKTGEWQHPLAAVVWLNLKLIDPSRGYDFSDELALDFLTRGLLASPDGQAGLLEPGEIEQRQERIFARYPGWPERQQLLMYPFAGFRIPFVVRQRYVACAQPFVPATSLPAPTVSPPATAGMPVSVSQTWHFTNTTEFTITHNLGRRVLVDIYNEAGDNIDADINYDSLNSLTIHFSQPLSGTVVLL